MTYLNVVFAAIIAFIIVAVKELLKKEGRNEPMNNEEKTKANIQIKGSKKAIEKMLKLIEEIEDVGVEVKLTIEKTREEK